MTTWTLQSFTGPLLGSKRSIAGEAGRVGSGLALAAVYGLSLGARLGVRGMAEHGVGVPVALFAVGVVGGPAFYVALAHAGVDVNPPILIGSLARGIATSGLVLAGLAPALLLLGVTCEGQGTAAFYGAVGLAVGGALGLRAMFQGLEAHQQAHRLAQRLPRILFALFACVFCWRIWGTALPILGGGS